MSIIGKSNESIQNQAGQVLDKEMTEAIMNYMAFDEGFTLYDKSRVKMKKSNNGKEMDYHFYEDKYGQSIDISETYDENENKYHFSINIEQHS